MDCWRDDFDEGIAVGHDGPAEHHVEEARGALSWQHRHRGRANVVPKVRECVFDGGWQHLDGGLDTDEVGVWPPRD